MPRFAKEYSFIDKLPPFPTKPASFLQDAGDSEICLGSLKITEEKSAHLDDILVGEGLVGFVVLGVLEKNLVHVGARILIQLVTRTEDNQGDLTVAQYRQLVRLLHHPELPFVEGHLLKDRKKSIVALVIRGISLFLF